MMLRMVQQAKGAAMAAASEAKAAASEAVREIQQAKEASDISRSRMLAAPQQVALEARQQRVAEFQLQPSNEACEEPEPEPEPEASLVGLFAAANCPRRQQPGYENVAGSKRWLEQKAVSSPRPFNVHVLPGDLVAYETKIFVRVASVPALHAAVAQRLGVDEDFRLWQLGSTQEMRLIDSLDQLGDALTIHLELSDLAQASRSLAAANGLIFAQMRESMAAYMEEMRQAGQEVTLSNWLVDERHGWMNDTGGVRSAEGVPVRALGSEVVKRLWVEEETWHSELANDERRWNQQEQGAEVDHKVYALSVFPSSSYVLAECATPVLVRVSSHDNSVQGLVASICRRLRLPEPRQSTVVLSIGNGDDVCGVVSSLKQLHSTAQMGGTTSYAQAGTPVQLWKQGTGPDTGSAIAASVVTTSSVVVASAPEQQRLLGQLQLAVTHPDVRRAASDQVVDVVFPASGSTTTPPHCFPSFVFSTHHSALFRDIRASHACRPESFFTPMMALVPIHNPAGSSGASFLTTADASLFFKTVSRAEFSTLARLLPALSRRLTAATSMRRHPGASAALAWSTGLDSQDPTQQQHQLAPGSGFSGSLSLLPRFMSLYTVSSGNGLLGSLTDTVDRLIVMSNALPPTTPCGNSFSYMSQYGGRQSLISDSIDRTQIYLILMSCVEYVSAPNPEVY